MFKWLPLSVITQSISCTMYSHPIAGNNELDFDEFCDLMSRHKKDVTSYKAIEEAFKVFDKDGKGELTISTYYQCSFRHVCSRFLNIIKLSTLNWLNNDVSIKNHDLSRRL